MAQQPFLYKKKLSFQNLSNSNFIHKYGIYLPNHYNLGNEDVDFIANEFKKKAKPIFFKND